MANEVKITATGDEKDAVRSLRAMDESVERTADEVKDAGERISRSWQQSSEDSERASRRAAEGFDRLGESADTLDTRAMGARDGLTSLEDGMAGVAELSQGNLLQGLLLSGSSLADLGSTSANFVAPTLRDLVTRLGTVRLALLGVAGVAGIAAAAVLWFATQGERASVTLEDIQEDLDVFLRSGGVFTGELRRIFGESTESIENFRRFTAALERDDALGDLARAGIGEFDDALRSLDEGLAGAIETSEDYVRATDALRAAMGDQAFQEAIRLGLLDQFLEKGLDVVRVEGLIADEAQEVAEGFKLSSTNLQEFTDLLKAQTNPVFAYAKAEQAVVAAQEAYNEALMMHGPESEEARRASLDLLAAQVDLEAAAAKANDTSKETVRQLHAMAEGGLASAAGVAELERQLGSAQARAKAMEEMRIQLIIEEVRAGGRSIEDLNWRAIGMVTGPGKMHDGGVVPGTVGQDVLAILQAGERVIPLDEADGRSMRPAPVPINLSGSRYLGMLLEDLAQLIRDRGGEPGFVLTPAA